MTATMQPGKRAGAFDRGHGGHRFVRFGKFVPRLKYWWHRWKEKRKTRFKLRTGTQLPRLNCRQVEAKTCAKRNRSKSGKLMEIGREERRRKTKPVNKTNQRTCQLTKMTRENKETNENRDKQRSTCWKDANLHSGREDYEEPVTHAVTERPRSTTKYQPRQPALKVSQDFTWAMQLIIILGLV